MTPGAAKSGLLLCVVLGAASGGPGPLERDSAGTPHGYHAAQPAGTSANRDSLAARRRSRWRDAGSHEGLLSIGGLPPVPGRLSVDEGNLVFVPSDGSPSITYGLYHGSVAPGAHRRVAAALMEIDHARGDDVYLIHLDGAVLETASPGILRQLVTDSAAVDSLGPLGPRSVTALAPEHDAAAEAAILLTLAESAFADSMYRLFGAPARPLGLVGERGRHAGRLGEYIGSRDSISLSPSGMTTLAQLRHAFAHELAHRWQRAAPDEFAALWRSIPPIRDSLRYGFRDRDEHQAEAAAFAVHYLQATTDPGLAPDAASDLLEAYERLVPGTSAMARHLAAQPVYRNHPLARTVLAPDPHPVPDTH